MNTGTLGLTITTSLIGSIAEKRILGGWKTLYALQNRCRETSLWDWKTIKVFFELLVCTMILYGSKLWAINIPVSKWKQIEKIQKHLIMNKFKIKSLVSYKIMLRETGATFIEAIVRVRLIRYLQRIEQMGEGRWPKLIFNERISKRKK